MTVSIQSTKTTYDGNDSATQFAIPFPFQNSSDITVIHIDSSDNETTLVLDTNYSISGSTLTYPISGTPLATGEKLVIYRNTPLTQPYDLDNQSQYFLTMLENAVDRTVLLAQQLKEMFDRCPKMDITDTDSPPSITDFNTALTTVQALQTAFENLVVKNHSAVATSGQTEFTMPAAWPDLDATSNVTVYDDGLKIDRDDYSVTDTDKITFDVGRTSGHTIIFELNEALSSDDLDSALKNHKHYNAIENSFCQIAQGSAYTLVKDVYGEGEVIGFEGLASGTTVDAGTLTQKTNSALSTMGYSIHFSGVTLTGSGYLYLRKRIYSGVAKKFKNRYASFSCKVLHDVGITKTYRIYVRKANALDDFSGVTAIGDSGPLDVASATNVPLKYENINMGDCSNGIEILVLVSCGAVTTKNFEFSELQFEDSTTASNLELQQNPIVLQTVYKKYSDYDSNSPSTPIPLDDSKPQNDEGDEYMTVEITPIDANSILVIEAVGYFGINSTASEIVGALFRNNDTDAISGAVGIERAATNIDALRISHEENADTVSKITYKFRVGLDGGTSAISFNGYGGTRYLGGVMNSFMRITEIKQ